MLHACACHGQCRDTAAVQLHCTTADGADWSTLCAALAREGCILNKSWLSAHTVAEREATQITNVLGLCTSPKAVLVHQNTDFELRLQATSFTATSLAAQPAPFTAPTKPSAKPASSKVGEQPAWAMHC